MRRVRRQPSGWTTSMSLRYGANGLEQLKNGNKVEIELLPGEGRFIEIN